MIVFGRLIFLNCHKTRRFISVSLNQIKAINEQLLFPSSTNFVKTVFDFLSEEYFLKSMIFFSYCKKTNTMIISLDRSVNKALKNTNWLIEFQLPQIDEPQTYFSLQYAAFLLFLLSQIPDSKDPRKDGLIREINQPELVLIVL